MKIRKFGVTLLCSGLLVLSLSLFAAELEELDGIIEPHATVHLSFPVEGVVQTIHVDRSDQVNAGQEVARLESSVEQAAVHQARAQAQRNGEVLARQASLKFARSKLQRVKELFASKAISSLEKEEADTKVTLARMELRQAKEDKTVAEQNLKRTEAVLERRRIESPISGVVVERFVSPGEFVKENPVLRIAQLDPLRVEVIAPASMFNKIVPNMEAEVIPESPVTGNYPARVTVVDQIIDAASGTFGVRLELPNPDYQLPGGLRCRVRFLPGTESALSQVETKPELDRLAAAPVPVGDTAKSVKPDQAVSSVVIPSEPPAMSGVRSGGSIQVGSSKAKNAVEDTASASVSKVSKAEDCALLGPFRSKRRFDQVGAELQGDHKNLVISEKRKVKPHGYSLLASPDVTGLEQQRFISRLKKQGITDFLALGRGRFKGRLALGHFPERYLAEERQVELKAKGFSSEIEPRYRVRRWLELRPGPDYSGSLNGLLQQVETNWPDMDLDLVSCTDKKTARSMEKLVSK